MKARKAKNILLAAITLTAVIVLCCTAYISIRLYVNQYIRDNYQRRVSIWQETADRISNNGIVFIGDSHTEYFELNEYFPGFPIFNRGIYGDTTYGVKKRLDESAFMLNPSKVFLLIGANDVNKTNNTNEVIVDNIKDIVRQLKTVIPNTTVYVQSLYPVNQSGKNSSRISIYKLTNERLSAINLLLRSFCGSEGIIYIDMFSQLIDEKGQLREEFSIEGLHLNEAGYRFVADVLRPYIEN